MHGIRICKTIIRGEDNFYIINKLFFPQDIFGFSHKEKEGKCSTALGCGYLVRFLCIYVN